MLEDMGGGARSSPATQPQPPTPNGNVTDLAGSPSIGMPQSVMPLSEEVVREGVSWLDSQYPNWWRNIERNQLDVRSYEHCPLAQASRKAFAKAAVKHRLSPSTCMRFGFLPGPLTPSLALNDFWLQAIATKYFIEEGLTLMVCQPCKDGRHEGCPGGTYCDCQHRPPREEDTSAPTN